MPGFRLIRFAPTELLKARPVCRMAFDQRLPGLIFADVDKIDPFKTSRRENGEEAQHFVGFVMRGMHHVGGDVGHVARRQQRSTNKR